MILIFEWENYNSIKYYYLHSQNQIPKREVIIENYAPTSFNFLNKLEQSSSPYSWRLQKGKRKLSIWEIHWLANIDLKLKMNAWKHLGLKIISNHLCISY